METTTYRPRPTWSQSLLIILALCFAIYVDLLQTLPLAFSQQLITEFNLSFEQFNQVVGSFEAPFLFLLLFFGFIVDLFGAKKSLLLALVLLGGGNLIFGHVSVTHPDALISARFIMGMGALLATVSLLVLLAQQLARPIFCVAVGLLLAVITLTKFLGIDAHLFLHHPIEWLYSSMLLSILGGALFVGCLFIPGEYTEATRSRLNIDDLVSTLTNRNIWLIGLVAMCGYLFIYLFISVIGPGFLATVGNVDQHGIANIFNYGVFSLVAGLLLLAKLGYFVTDHRKLLQTCYAIAAVSFTAALLLVKHYQFDLILLCITSFMAAAYVLSYAIINENSQRLCLGTSFSIVFILIYLGSLLSDFLMQFVAIIWAEPLSWQWWTVISIIPGLFIAGIVLAALLKPAQIRTASSTANFTMQLSEFFTQGGALGRAFWLVGILGTLFVGSVVLTLLTPIDPLLMRHGIWTAVTWSQLARLFYLVFAVICIMRAHPQPNTWQIGKPIALVLIACLAFFSLIGFLQNSGIAHIQLPFLG